MSGRPVLRKLDGRWALEYPMESDVSHLVYLMGDAKGAVVDRGHEEDESVHELLLRHVGDVSGLAGYLPGNVRVLPRPPGHILLYPRPALSSLRDTVCGLLPSRDARLPGRANWHSRSLRWNLRRGR